MDLLENEGFLFSKEEEFLIKKILFTHDPDGRRLLHSELLLRAFETIMRYATPSQGIELDHPPPNGLCKIEVVGSKEPLGHTIYKISHHLLCQCTRDRDLHTKAMALFDMLSHYRWDAKVVLVLAAFGIIYGELWLILQLQPNNPLAALLAMLKQLPNNLVTLRHRFKALNILVNTMVNVTKCIIKFEYLPIQHVVLDKETLGVTKSKIYIAAYWVIRSALTCSSQIKDLVAIKNEQVHSNSIAMATWELSSLVIRLSSILGPLRRHVDMCHQLIETEVHNKLLNMFKETHIDNQEVLHMLFALKDDFPLKHCFSQEKVGVSQLNNKIIILLISKPEFTPIEKLLFLVQQTYDHPYQKKLEGDYEIVWVPIPSSNTWTQDEIKSFEFLSKSLPWYTIRQPWLPNSGVVKFIKQEWNFMEEPLMVVLDSQGMVTNTNAIDMVLIWGVRAYPFSDSRERELWEEDNWTTHLLLGGIDPLVSMWEENGRNICIYGSNNLDWIRELNAKMREMKKAGLQLEMVYVGNKNPSPSLTNILATIDEEHLGTSLNFQEIKFFWLRLENMRTSKLHLGHNDFVLNEVSSLLDTKEDDNGWVVIGSSVPSREIVKLQGVELRECLDAFPIWGEYVRRLGLVGAIRSAFGPPLLVEPCSNHIVVPYSKELFEGTLLCEKCKCPMEKYVLCKCDGKTE